MGETVAIEWFIHDHFRAFVVVPPSICFSRTLYPVSIQMTRWIRKWSSTEMLLDEIGLSFFIASFGMMLGPPFFGFLVDLFDSFLWSWLFLAFCMIIVSLLAFWIMYKARKNLAKAI